MPALPDGTPLRLRSTVVAVLEVVIAVSAVRLIGLGTGAVVTERVAVVLRTPPLRFSAPVPSPSVEVPLILICPALRVVAPE